MKKMNMVYWIFTVLLALAMLSAAIPEMINNPESAKFMTRIGFPTYMNPFLGAAKLLAIVALLVPGFPRLKEWAYAGLFFDLTGATYAFVATGQDPKGYIFMLVFFIILFGSYISYHKRRSLRAVKQ